MECVCVRLCVYVCVCECDIYWFSSDIGSFLHHERQLSSYAMKYASEGILGRDYVE